MQSAEFNEVQSALQHQVRQVADAMFDDGAIISGAQIVVNAETGACGCQAGALYLRGAVRGVAPASLTVATVGTVQVGIYLTEVVITELEDPGLRDPAIGMRNYQEAGAARLRIDTAWGVGGTNPGGEFYPVWTVVDGVVLPKEAPPSIDAISNAIASYDRQSTGGTYIVSGLRVTALADLETGQQVYSISNGEARINGRSVALSTSRRLVYPAIADLRRITAEPKVSSGPAAQRILLDRTPAAQIVQVQITAEKTATVTHGAFTGAQDALPDSAVLELLEVKQGGTTYVQGTDYRLTAGKVDWSLTGAEPSPGSSYSVKYRYIATVTPTAVDETGYTVEGAVAGTLVQSTYDARLPRIDRLCLSPDGEFVWVAGVSADYTPAAPSVPSNLLLLATIEQTWFTGQARAVRNDGVKVVPMAEIEDIRAGMLDLYDLVAQQRLQVDANSRLSAASKGLFVDAFRDNAQRDAGQDQSAVAFGEILQMPVTETAVDLPVPGGAPATLAHTQAATVSQLMRTTTMQVNPYLAFEPVPARITLSPAVDHFSQSVTQWAPSVFLGSGNTQSLVRTDQIGSTVIETYSLRQIQVSFTLSGFGPGESLNQVIFDGINVTHSVAGA